MKCKHEPCSNELKGTSAYCSNSCRAQHSRRNKTGAAQQSQAQHVGATSSATSEDSQAQEVQFNVSASHVIRTNPDNLNYGKPLSMHQLDKAGLKANRVPIPGDHDYIGCCEKVEDKWQVRGTA